LPLKEYLIVRAQLSAQSHTKTRESRDLSIWCMTSSGICHFEKHVHLHILQSLMIKETGNQGN